MCWWNCSFKRFLNMFSSLRSSNQCVHIITYTLLQIIQCVSDTKYENNCISYEKVRHWRRNWGVLYCKKVFFFQNVFSDFCGSSKSWKNILSLVFSFSKNNLFCKYFSIILPNLQEYIIWGNKFHWLLQGQIWKVGHVFVRRRWQNILGQLVDFDR